MSKYNVNSYQVSSLLTWIKSGEIAIPEIQRPFVWDATKVRDLMDSLYQGYPVGYLIVWKNPDVHLKDGTKSSGKKILIDGQQRVTALQAAIAGQPVVNDQYKKVRIRIAFNPLTEKFDVANVAISKDSHWIEDVSLLFKDDFSTLDFVLGYCADNGIDSKQEMKKLDKVLTRLRGIQSQPVGCIELEDTLDIAQVTEIFIRINSKGVVLSQADFAMSKIAADETHGGNTIRKTVDYFCRLMKNHDDLPMLMENDSAFMDSEEGRRIQWIARQSEECIYQPDYNDVLRVAFTYRFQRGRLSDLVSLLSGRDFETRTFIEEIVIDSFQKLRESVMEVVREYNFLGFVKIVKSTGLIKAGMIRSQNALNFAYALFLALKERGTPPARIERLVRVWLVFSLLVGRYSGSAESAFDYDIKRFCEAEEPEDFLDTEERGNLSDAFWEDRLVDYHLKTSSAGNNAYQIYLAAQSRLGANGFLSDHMQIRTLVEDGGHIHHVFPKNYLKNNGYDKSSDYNQIANYALTQTEINIFIKDKAPKEYMAKIHEQIRTGEISNLGGIRTEEELQKNLRDNCIPEGFSEMTVENYPAFLVERRKLMAQWIRDYYQSLH